MQKALRLGLFAVITVMMMTLPAAAADIVAVDVSPSGIVWRPLIRFETGVASIATPDGLVYTEEFRPGGGISFNPFTQRQRAVDGIYQWQISLGQPSTVSPKLQEAARANRGGDGDPDIEALHRAASTRATQVQSGAFTILNGALVPSNLVEPGARKGDAGPRSMTPAPFKQADWPQDDPSVGPADIVQPDDVIIQGSLCVGLDCVNNESFGFDTIRLKENNTRIKFDDTSVSAGFPANDWQLTANDSASGGSSKFSIEDITGSKVPFTITAGASTNSIFVDSTGRVGFRTSTPVLDLHVNTSNTPALRLEQNNSGGFTAQTWDVAGNEANFFVRDVTGGSRLPFRIRPGAPTSSIDISADGDVGVGTASPLLNLDIRGTNAKVQVGSDTAAAGFGPTQTGYGISNATEKALFGVGTGLGFVGTNSATSFALLTNNSSRVTILSGGNVGIGTTTPAQQLHTTGTVRFAAVACAGGNIVSNASGDLACAVSSRRFKNVAGDLEPQVALANVMSLRPQVGSYKETPDIPEHWLIAEETAAVDPALVGLLDGKPFVIKTQNVVADLIAVVQQQQRRIEEQQRFIEQQQSRLEALERATPR